MKAAAGESVEDVKTVKPRDSDFGSLESCRKKAGRWPCCHDVGAVTSRRVSNHPPWDRLGVMMRNLAMIFRFNGIIICIVLSTKSYTQQ